MTQACGATAPRFYDPGWECTGSGLIVVTHYRDLPVVLPARALDVIEPESWWDDPIVPFAGGDHLHLVVPRRPTTFRGDAVMALGDAAARWKYLGGVDGGGQMWMGAR